MFNINLVSTYPQVTETDIKRKYIYRYFASKANQINKEVFEITRRDYDIFVDYNYIVLGSLKWVIKGSLEDTTLVLYTGTTSNIFGTESIVVPGVLTQNRSSVIFLSKKIPSIINYLTDYKQFYIED